MCVSLALHGGSNDTWAAIGPGSTVGRVSIHTKALCGVLTEFMCQLAQQFEGGPSIVPRPSSLTVS
jgi:hypothetical protein